MLKTKITELLGIQYPIIQGGMAWVADASLASAVSNAGGLGLIAAANAPVDYVREQIRGAKNKTQSPFGVNIMLLSPCADDVAQLVIDEGVKVVTTGAGLPSKYIKEWKNAGIIVIPVVASCATAKLSERLGADAVVCEGCEAGGHIGDLTTMVIVPQVSDSVSVPVIAAGGIADGRGMAAAFILGACGVQVGTRFLTARECTIHQNYKDKIVAAKDIDTIVTGRKTGHPVRSLKTPFSLKFSKVEYDSAYSMEQIEELGAGALRAAAVDGDLERGSFMSGQSAGMVKAEQSAREIIEDIVLNAEKILGGAGGLVSRQGG